MSDQKKKKTFEEAMTELEASVSCLENGKLTLEESLATFEKAVALVKQCRKELDCAEKKIAVLLKDEDGNPTGDAVPFFPSADGDSSNV